MIGILIGKIAFLFLAVLFTIVNLGLIYRKGSIGAINFVLQSVGIVGFVVLQWLI